MDAYADDDDDDGVACVQARVHGVRERRGRAPDAQYRADIERAAGQQVAGRCASYLRRRQVATRRARPRHQAVLQLGTARRRRTADSRRSEYIRYSPLLGPFHGAIAVSYTHLTLPTIYSV